MDELDRILSSEKALQPSSGLTAAVMERVRREAAEPEPIAFPWRRFVPGAIACFVLLVAGLVMIAQYGIPQSSGTSQLDVEQLLSSPEVLAWGWAAAALAFAWVVLKMSFRFSFRRI